METSNRVLSRAAVASRAVSGRRLAILAAAAAALAGLIPAGPATASVSGTLSTAAGGPGGPGRATKIAIGPSGVAYGHGHLYIADGYVQELGSGGAAQPSAPRSTSPAG